MCYKKRLFKIKKGSEMRLLISTAFIALSFTTCVFAGNTPISCPDAEVIKSIGLNYVTVIDGDNTWQAAWLPSNNYQTKQDWYFYMGGAMEDKVGDVVEAIAKAKAALQTLHFFQGPINNGNTSLCYYLTDGKAAAIAVSPPFDVVNNNMKRK
jgi:hypothetical protein